VPLDTDHESQRGVLDSLDRAIVGAAGNNETFTKVIDALMVVAINDSRGRAEQASQCGSPFEFHPGFSIEAGTGRVSLVIDDIGQVLVQGSATYDVEHLQASTDCQEW
jgi:hypothetical protein